MEDGIYNETSLPRLLVSPPPCYTRKVICQRSKLESSDGVKTLLLSRTREPGVVTHTFASSTPEADTGRSL